MDGKSPAQTACPIDFLIVGAGISGLASAIALRRVGHRVLVLEQDGEDEQLSGGCRLPPNVTKILFHWGLEAKLRGIAITSDAIMFSRYESGELLGTHVWDEELIKETRGEFMFAHHADFRRLLYQTAFLYGAKIRRRTRVVSIDSEERSVTLASGEILRADVIIGADGPNSLARQQLLEEEELPLSGTPTGLMMYNTTIPKRLIMRDPELRHFYDQKHTNLFVSFGDGRCALGFPLGRTSDFALHIYGPADGTDLTWHQKASRMKMMSDLGPAESRLQKLVNLATPPAFLTVKEEPVLENWVHDSGRMVVIGEAAHPLPPGGIQGAAMAVEDGAVLAKIFSHLLREDQIATFLFAFQDLRQDRVAMMLKTEGFNIMFMTLPSCEMQEMRDNGFKMLHAAGKNVMDAGEATEQWEEIKITFAYDCEDEADDWWVNWGLLRERANQNPMQTGIHELNIGVLSIQVDETDAD